MGQNPVVWALGIAAIASLGAVTYGGKLADRVGMGEAPSAASMTAASPPASADDTRPGRI